MPYTLRGPSNGTRVADDFYLAPCQVHRLYGFTGRTITNSLRGFDNSFLFQACQLRITFLEGCIDFVARRWRGTGKG